jgi:integrase
MTLEAATGQRITGKPEALAAADALRTAIRAGRFRQPPTVTAPVSKVCAPGELTFAAFAETWLQRAREGKVTNAPSERSYVKRLSAIALDDGSTLGDRSIGRITEDDLELVFGQLRTAGLSASSRNHYLQAIRSMQKWGRRKGYLERPWLTDVSELKRERHNRRDRRLHPGEEKALLGAAGPWLQRLIIAALESGCRRGELLSLQWQDVSLSRGEITIRAEKAKSRTHRILPISPRLRAVLQMVQHDPAGREHKPLAYVFGDAIGRRVVSPKKQWETTVLKAHKHEPEWIANHKLSPESRAALRLIDLHFHDLRHEAGSRMLEAGWPQHHIQEMLGHADLKQTSTYLNVTRAGLHDSMRRFGTMPLLTHGGPSEAPEDAETDSPVPPAVLN